MTALEVEDLVEAQEHDGGGSVQVYGIVMNMEVEHEPIVVQTLTLPIHAQIRLIREAHII